MIKSVLFTASWCRYCKVVGKFLKDNPQITNVDICDVDVDTSLPAMMGVTQLPALLKLDGTLMVESLDIIQYIKDTQ